MNKLEAKLESAGQWLRLRKNTTPVHWGVGALCVGLAYLFFPAGLALLAIFAGMEAWNDYCAGKKEGFDDWLDAFLVFCVGLTVLVILQFCGRIAINWY